MQAITPSSLLAPGLQNDFTPKGDVQTASTKRVEAGTQTKADLTIVTAEGDKVTLTAASSSRATYATYNAQGRLQGGGHYQVQTAALRLRASNDVSLVIEGELSAAELADIEQLLADIEEIATDFFAADVDALTQTLDIGAFDTLASFNASLHFEERISVYQRNTENTVRAEPSEAAAQAEPSETDKHADASVERLVDRLLQTVQGAQIASARIAVHIPEFVTNLFERLTEAQDAETPKRQLATSITAKFAQRFRFIAMVGEATAGAPKPEVETDSTSQDTEASHSTAAAGTPDNPPHASESSAAPQPDPSSPV